LEPDGIYTIRFFAYKNPTTSWAPGLKDLGFRLNLFAESEAKETIHGDGITQLFALGFK
jgi:hypothetical protein